VFSNIERWIIAIVIRPLSRRYRTFNNLELAFRTFEVSGLRMVAEQINVSFPWQNDLP
jgi:hypothetical protein